MTPQQLEKVALAAQAEQGKAAVNHSRLNADLGQQRQRLEQLQRFRSEYETRLEAMARAGIEARRLADYRRFLSGLSDAIQRQTEEIAQHARGVEESRDALHAASLRRESVEQLAGRARSALLQARERREQRASDDDSQQRHYRRDAS